MIHDVSHVGFSLKDYIAGLDARQLLKSRKKFNSFAPEKTDIEIPGEDRKSIAASFQSIPRRAIWWSTMTTVGIIYENKRVNALRQQHDEMRAKA